MGLKPHPRSAAATTSRDRGSTADDHASVIVGRAEDGVVVVTIRGVPDPGDRGRLGQMLVDLIDGQGNLFIAVEMPDAHAIDIPTLDVLLQAADHALAHGARLTITTPVGHWDGPGTGTARDAAGQGPRRVAT